MSQLGREDLQKLMSLYARQPWIIAKEKELFELLRIGQTREHRDLILELLRDFHYLTDSTIAYYLKRIAEYISADSGFSEITTQVSSVTYDASADSSQAVLHWLKLSLHELGWANVETVNKFGRSLTIARNGRPQIIFVDEFVGSGKTIIGRMDYFAKNVTVQCDVKFCFLAGMASGIEKIRNLGFDVFCPLILNKGISDMPASNGRFEKIEYMKELEGRLAQVITSFRLADYSFGYGKAEALYSLESRSMNTPNSVFPLFWWPKLLDGTLRNTLVRRVERGLA